MRRHELTDAHWALVEPLLPTNRPRKGRRWNPHRPLVNGIFWILRTGAPWRDVPERYGPWQTVYDRFNRWSKDGTWDRLLEALQVRLDQEGRIDWDLWCIDGSVVRACRAAAGAGGAGGPDEPADHALGRSRGGFGTKLHLVTDGHGLPLAVAVSPGQAHESQYVEHTMNAVRIPQRRGRPRRRPRRLAGDKGYSYPRVRQWLRRHKVQAVIPYRCDQRPATGGRSKGFDKARYRRRHVIECCVGWLKECRRVATRYEKLALTYLGMLKLAMVQRYLRQPCLSDTA